MEIEYFALVECVPEVIIFDIQCNNVQRSREERPGTLSCYHGEKPVASWAGLGALPLPHSLSEQEAAKCTGHSESA